jgi:hypothetical protein
MRHARQLAWAAPLIGAALLTAAACGSSSSSSSTKSTSTMSSTGTTSTQSAANAQLCAAVSQMKTSIADFKNLSTNTSLTEFASLTSGVAAAWTQLEAAAKTAKGIDTTQLGNAVNTFESTMTSLPAKHLSFSQDITQAKAALQPVAQAAQTVAPNCGTSTSTSGS